MKEDVIFRYKNGRIIPIKVKQEQTTNDYMNDKIRGKKNDFNEKYEIVDGDFYKEWNEAGYNFSSKKNWGEYKRISAIDKKTGKEVGYLKYEDVSDFTKTSMTDKINVVNVVVNDKYRRQGIATELYKELQKRAGDNDIYLGEVTPEGQKLIKAIGTVTKEEIHKGAKNPKHWWVRIKE